jgi:hypothetical protein
MTPEGEGCGVSRKQRTRISAQGSARRRDGKIRVRLLTSWSQLWWGSALRVAHDEGGPGQARVGR